MQQRLKVSIQTKSERITLAQDIHDGIAQDLVALGYSLDELLARPEVGGELRSDLRALRISISDSLERVRRELFNLRTPTHPNLKSELESLFSSFVRLKTGYCEVEVIALPIEIHTLIIRIARELLRNAAIHSNAERIWLSLMTTPSHLVLTVGDDGVGGAHISQERFGLLGVEEKVHQLGGDITILGHHGSVVTVSLPLSHM